jgi:mannose/fructose/N-acetylgalactosamine-specific phosphotransferase system component IIC
MILQALLTASLLNLDRRSFGHTMLSRPLGTGVLVGLALGRPEAGLTLGLWTELLWLARAPLGGFIVPNGGLAVSAALLGWSLAFGPAIDSATVGPDLPAESLARASLALVFAFIPPMAHLATLLETVARNGATKMVATLEDDLARGLKPPLMWYNLKGLLTVLIGGLVYLTVVPLVLAAALSTTGPTFSIETWTALGKLAPLVPLVGLAVLAENLRGRRLVHFLAVLAAFLIVMVAKG